ncbi:MAG: aldose 1-epimerase [Eubacteriales bacterium]|nr:aldose 1-epimerase [Eubacteriales bacterium]
MEEQDIQWNGLRAVRLTGGGYEAVIAPDFGANCISLRRSDQAFECLRTPPSLQALAQAPNVYGLPLLFPPNRIHGGTYVFEGRAYSFPINEPARSSHLHGVLSATPFARAGEGAFVYHATREAPYLSFPHAFTLERRYALDERGLTHQIVVTNHSEHNMPLGLGVHAAWRVFSPEARLQIPVLRQWAVDAHTIVPTGEKISDGPLLDTLREGRLLPEEQALSCLLECAPGPVRLSDGKVSFCCQADANTRFLMLWNGGGHAGFVCPEPQTWLVDAPNLPWSPAETGMSWLRPGETRCYELRYYVERRQGGSQP